MDFKNFIIEMSIGLIITAAAILQIQADINTELFIIPKPIWSGIELAYWAEMSEEILIWTRGSNKKR